MPFIVIGVVVLIIILFFIITYNGLVNKKNQVKNVFGTIDAMLKKRYDLIPNLVSSCKQYMKHEEGILTKVTELRSKAVSSESDQEMKASYDNQLGEALRTLNVTVENYPELKANENFMQLQRTLNTTEEQISASRRAYNAVVTDYNNALEMFPSSIVAGMMGLKQKQVIEITEEERQNVDVAKLFNDKDDKGD